MKPTPALPVVEVQVLRSVLEKTIINVVMV